jgi:ABC-2 type transport system ATP-binding protein
MAEAALEVRDLSKVFRRFRRYTTALAGVSLRVEPGTIFGLLGRNGAGKTTLVKILTGLLRPTSGAAWVLGRPASSWRMRRRVGYLPEQMRLPEFLKSESFLRYMGALNGMSKPEMAKRIGPLLERMELADARKKLLREYSKGMQQRLGLAQALLNDPDLLFLDEPTEGLDPLGRKQVRDLLLHLRAGGKTIFLNSHLLSEIELVCDQVMILDRGRVVRAGSPRELVHDKGAYRLKLARLGDDVREAASRIVIPVRCENNSLEVFPRDRAQLNALIDALRQIPVEIEAVEPVRSSFEESFIEAVAGGES